MGCEDIWSWDNRIVMGDPWRNATVAMKVHFSGSGSREDLSASSALDSLDIM